MRRFSLSLLLASCSTGDPPDDSTTGADAETAGGPTTGTESESSESESSEATGSTSDTGGEPEVCVEIGSDPIYLVCAPDCSSVNCTLGGDHTDVRCLEVPDGAGEPAFISLCVSYCTNDSWCQDGQECVDLDGDALCVWPDSRV
jgi:hypothetical protein